MNCIWTSTFAKGSLQNFAMCPFRPHLVQGLNTISTNIQDVILQFFNRTPSSLLCFIAGKTPWYTYREWLKICSSYYDTFIETWPTIQSHSTKPISRKRNIPKHSWWWDLYPFAFQQWNIMIRRQLVKSCKKVQNMTHILAYVPVLMWSPFKLQF